MNRPRTITVLLMVVFSLLMNFRPVHAQAARKFQVVAQYKTGLSILVSQNTTAEQLKALLFEFRAARNNKTLSKMIPPTTRGERFWIKEKQSYLSSEYGIVGIFVFSEPEWSSLDKLKRFIESKSAADDEFDKKYVKHIKTQYLWSFTSKESGSLGYDDGDLRSPNYEKLSTYAMLYLSRRSPLTGRRRMRFAVSCEGPTFLWMTLIPLCVRIAAVNED